MALSKPKLLPQTLISLIATLFLMLLLANKVHSQDTVSFAVDSFPPQPATLTYQRDAHVPSGSRFLCLTKTDNSGNPWPASVGRVLFSGPLQFWESSAPRQASFETTISFKVRSSSQGAAAGIAFFIAPVNPPIPPGSEGENFGIFGSSGSASNVFAVEFNTQSNRIGIDLLSRFSRNTTRFENVSGLMVTAVIKYDVTSRLISVAATAGSTNFAVTYNYDLKTILPQQVQVGISSSTGGTLTENGVHEIHSWKFTHALKPDVIVYNNQNTNTSFDEDTYARQYV